MRNLTAYLIIDAKTPQGWKLSDEKITCSVTGEMSDGTKVWTDNKSGKQYGLLRMLGKYYFYKF